MSKFKTLLGSGLLAAGLSCSHAPSEPSTVPVDHELQAALLRAEKAIVEAQEQPKPFDYTGLNTAGFVQISFQMRLAYCAGDQCVERQGSAVGSGSFVYNSQEKGASLILTAGHVCDSAKETLYGVAPDPEHSQVDVTLRAQTGKTLTTGMDMVYSASRLGIEELDLCFILQPFVPGVAVYPIAASRPKAGARVVHLGAPAGVWSPAFVDIESGWYLGHVTKADSIFISGQELGGRDQEMVSLGVSPGSSGGPVFNTEYELIGVIEGTPNTNPPTRVIMLTDLDKMRDFVKAGTMTIERM